MKKLFLFLLFTLCTFNLTQAQSLLDAIETESSSFNTASNPDLLTEQIEKISASGRIFIISNNSGGFGSGDFISIVVDNQLVNRAIVAKISNGSAGIKIIKVYSEKINQVLRPGMEVQIIRGDDSYFNVKPNEVAENEEAETLIEDEDELFDDTTLLEDDLTVNDNKNRAIKTDNLVSIYVGLVEAQDTSGESERVSQLSGSWAYQLDDNIYIEAGAGYSIINDYPNDGLDTTLTTFVAKIKYTVSGPFYSYFQPYVGYQIITPDSPGAGSDGVSDSVKEEELALVDDLQKNAVVFGVTALKRLVPGWFARLDVGTDAVNLGISLEF